ncbi:MAG TPA: type II secretion system F family protein, partial [Nitrosopumilaceae archaeon]|nr:type II secretion system F family protein [Nitrosopumilaceae archaeon]
MLEEKQKSIARQGKRKKRPAKASSQKTKMIIVSAVSAIIVIMISFVMSTILENTTIRDMGAVFGIIVGVMPPVSLNLKQIHRKNSIDKNLPIFLLGLRSSVVSGHSIIQGISEAANRKMGALTPELKNLRANLSWGMPVEEAFDNFVERVQTRTARRVMTLLQLAMETGGDVGDTIEVIQKHVSEMENLENERKSTMKPYIYTIYISFAVFLAIVAILVFQFFSEIEKIQTNLTAQGGAQAAAGLFGGLVGVDIKQLDKLMLHMSIVESVFGGLAAGKIGEGSFIAGVK